MAVEYKIFLFYSFKLYKYRAKVKIKKNTDVVKY